MLHSFRLKIGLLSMCLSGLLLLGFAVFASSVLKRVRLERIDLELRALADAQVRKSQPRGHWARFDDSLRSIYGPHATKQFLVRTTSPDGNELYASPQWPTGLATDALPLSLAAAPEKILEGPPRDADRRPRPSGTHGGVRPFEQDAPRPPPPRRLRVYGPVYATIGKPGREWRAMTLANEEVTLSVAMDLAGLRAETQRFRQALAIAGPLGLLLLAAGGWLIGHIALRPVTTISRTTEAVTAESLDARVPDERADDEFKRLIALINAMLARLERGFRQATRFSADAAHELKTPLAILQAQVERCLQRAADGSPEQREFAEQLDEVQRLKSILRKLLLLSQADAGQLSLSVERVNLADLVRAAASDVEMLATDRRTTLDVPAELFVRADPDLLKQVIENLVSNAIKFGDYGGTIEFQLRSRGAEAVLTVANSGRGIPESEQEKIFERFYRVDKARSRETEGTGLGLSLARDIVRAHGGELVLEHSEEGMTRFALVLSSPCTQFEG